MKKQASDDSDQPSVRERILRAAMEAFMELGYAATSTLKIATRARVSKREMYTQFGTKQAMLAACIADRAGRMRLPDELPAPRNGEELAAMLSRIGATVLREVGDPGVVAVFRLAIIEAERAPEVAATLETARRSLRAAVQGIVAQAQADGLLGAGDPDEMAGRYLALLWGDLMVSLLLRLRAAPDAEEIDRRAGDATGDFLRLYGPPGNRGPSRRHRSAASAMATTGVGRP